MTHSRRTVLGLTAGLAAALSPEAKLAFAQTQPRMGDGSAEFAVRTPDGLTLSGRRYGNPEHPEILLIHGLGQSRLSWELQTASDLINRFHVITYDLRGHGNSDKPESERAYADGKFFADDLRAVIVTAGLRRPTLVGWSLGGFAIGHYLARHGHANIAGVNLVNAVTKLSPELLSDTAKAYAASLAAPDLASRTEAIEGFLDACFATRPSEKAMRRMLVFNGMVPRAVQQGIVKMRSDGLDEAFAATERLLVTYGAKDKLTTPEMSRRVASLTPSARLTIFDTSGHSPFYEEPDRYNAELAAFAAL